MFGFGGGGLRWTHLWPLLAGASLCLLVLIMSLRESSPPRHSKTYRVEQEEVEEEETGRRSDLNYGIVVDAGSSGSRGFVYVWPPHSGDPHDLLRIKPLKDEAGYPVLKKISPGLSSQAATPENSTLYLSPLLDFAASKIPPEKHKETSLFVLATAGLRLIAESQRNAILDNLRKELPKRYPFIVMEQHIQMISGKWEGIYSWIAVNYALGKLDTPQSSNHTSIPRTVGMIDMGGGSVQIAYEIAQPLPAELAHLGTVVNLGCEEHSEEHQFRLYVSTFLGFGANSALQRWEAKLWKAAVADIAQTARNHRRRRRRRRRKRDNFPAPPSSPLNDSSSPPSLPSTSAFNAAQAQGYSQQSSANSSIVDPCLPLGLFAPLKAPKDAVAPSAAAEKLTRRGSGDWDTCLSRVASLLEKGAACEADPCSMQGRHQPPIDFVRMPFYGFSEYWYSSNDVASMGPRWDLEELKSRQREFCRTRWSTTKSRWRQRLYPKADLERIRTQCFKGAWIAAVLHEGFGFPAEQPLFKPVQTIRGQEVQWTLGAILYKLRYFPLREIQRLRDLQKQEHEHGEKRTSLLPSSAFARLLLSAFILGIFVAALRYFCLIHQQSSVVPPVSRLLPRSASALLYTPRNAWALWPRKEKLIRRSSSASDLLASVNVERRDYDYVY